MAHPVHCYYCGKKFDRDLEPYVEIPNISRRYAHKSCFENKDEVLSPERKDQIQLEEYIKALSKMDYVHPTIKKQIIEYTTQMGFTYSGIYKTLFYFYDILKNSKAIMLSNPNISIVPYVYPKAKEYYYKLYLANKLNKNKEINKPKEIIVKIRAPEREPLRQRNLFTFLDEEVDKNGE